MHILWAHCATVWLLLRSRTVQIFTGHVDEHLVSVAKERHSPLKRAVRKRTTKDLYSELHQAALDHLSTIYADSDTLGPADLKKMRFMIDFLNTGSDSPGVTCNNSLHFWAKPSKLCFLEKLWEKSQSGELLAAYWDEFVTSALLDKFNIRNVELSVEVNQAKYQELKGQFQETGTCIQHLFCSRCLKTHNLRGMNTEPVGNRVLGFWREQVFNRYQIQILDYILKET